MRAAFCVAITALTLGVSGLAQRPTDPQIREEIRQSMKQGAQVLGDSVRLSKELSGTIAPGKKLPAKHKASEMLHLRRRIAGAKLSPARGGFGGHERELDRPGRRPHERPGQVAPGSKPTDSVLPGNLDHLVSSSQEFRVHCARIAAALVIDDAIGERQRQILLSELGAPASRKSRYVLASVVDLVCALPALANKPSVQQLRRLQPALRKESKSATRAVDWGFSQLFAKAPTARTELAEYAKKVYEPRRAMAKRMQKRVAKRSGSWSHSNRDRARIAARQARGLMSNILNDIADNLQEDFDQGCEYGQTAGSVIGTVAGAQSAINNIASQTTVNGVLQATGDVVVDQINPFDPGAVIGHFAGGVVGMVGGAIGTTAGWICGTIESHMAHHRGARRSGKANDAKLDFFGASR
jgi:hypothetical protein